MAGRDEYERSSDWPVLNDMHCHLAFACEPLQIAHDAVRKGGVLFSNSVTPQERRQLIATFASEPGYTQGVAVGTGLHPWYLREDGLDDDIALLKSDIAACRFVGEIGLDADARHTHTIDSQKRVLEAALQAAASAGDRILSLHAVKSAGKVLELLRKTKAASECTCIFHWFSGTSDEMQAAIAQGCLFSVNRQMLQSKRGRAYARAIPAERLLLETDAPPSKGQPSSFVQLQDELRSCADLLREIRGLESVLQANEHARMLLAGVQ